ncbi:MAG TPA: hypothetical protein VFQ45_07045 [Longimicrobium sp.]|nr:hypothetical protein [Longimicrobium sp.]
MRVAMLVWLAVVAAVAASLFAAQYLAALPYAPDCPACHTVTQQTLRATALDRALARMGGAASRQCPRCGWAGRMRWRVAAQRVRAPE